ncbi:MAG: PAS domain S-box protein, partial [Balneolaceae bacterium]
MRSIPKILELNALSLTFAYLVVALFWILLSDFLVEWITDDLQVLSKLQTLKGFIFITCSAGLIYLLIEVSNKKIHSEKKVINDALEAASMAAWSMDIKTHKSIPSKGDMKLIGVDNQPSVWHLQDLIDSLHPDDKNPVFEAYMDSVQNETPYNVSYRIIKADGSTRWMHSRGAIQHDDMGKASKLMGVVADITEQKKREEKYQKDTEIFERIFKSIPVMITIYNPEIETIRVNPAFENLLGWKNTELQEIDFMDACYPDKKERLRALAIMKQADGIWEEFSVQTKNGDIRTHEWSNIRLSDDTRIGIGLDVTELRASQSKIQESRELLLKTFESLNESVTVLDPDMLTIVEANKSTEHIFGYASEELIGSTTSKLHLSDEKFREFRELAQKSIEEKGVFNTEFVMLKKDGSIINTDNTITLVRKDNGEVDKVVSVIRDITHKKKNEKALQELTSRYKRAEEIALIGHWNRNLETDHAIWSDGFYNVLGINKEETDTDFENLINIIYPEDREHFRSTFSKALKTGHLDVHYRVARKSGELGHFHEMGEVEYDDDGKARFISGTIQDITESYESQFQLQKSQQLMKKTFESLEESVLILSSKTRTIIDCNPYTERMFGYSKEELIGASTDILHQNEAAFQEFQEISTEDIKTKGVFQTEFKMKKKNGEIFYSDHTVSSVYGEDGKLDLIISVVRDITEIKEAEIKLQKEKERFELVANTASDVIWDLDVVNNLLWWSDGFEKNFGYKMEDLSEGLSSWTNAVHPEDLEHASKSLEKALASKAKHWYEEYRIKRADGSIAFIEDNGYVIRDENGAAIQMVGALNDVTEKKLAKKKLQESEEKYRQLFEQNPLPMWIFDPKDLSFKEVNEAAVKHYGYSREEFYSMNLLDIRPEGDYHKLKSVIKNRKQKFIEAREWRHLKKNGDLINVKITSSSIDYFGNRYRLILVNDITEQKKADERVIASLVEGENKERARLARELHDGL